MSFGARVERHVFRAILFASIGALLANLFILSQVFALASSSLELSYPRPSETNVTYTFNSSGFDTGTTIRCISLDFNTQADGGGSVPTGLTTTGASLSTAGTLINEASWTSSFGSNGSLDITFATGETPAASGTLVYDAITNGSTASTTYFGIFSTYTNVDCSTGQTDTAIVAFEFTDGVPVQLTVDPTLTFTVAGVASGSVNGATITHSSAGAAIDYQTDVDSATNGVSAHDLQVQSNGSGGYSIYIRHTAQLTNGASDTIDNHTGTNNSPTTLSTGTEAWGYTTEDSVLTAVGDGADRFTNPGNEWAGFSTTNGEVAYNAVDPTGTETTRVGHQVAVATTTETGTYTTTIVYTVVPVF